MRKSKNDVIRKDDVVKIINPEFFIRCGYPMTIRDAIEKIMQDDSQDKKDLYDFAKRFNVYAGGRDFRDMTKIVAYGKLKKEGFGGNERKIYTKSIPEAKGINLTVMYKKVVVTGDRIPGSSAYSDPYGYVEAEPPYLSNSKPHNILYFYECKYDLSPYKNEVVPLFRGELVPFSNDDFNFLAIEEKNVEKVKEKEINCE